VSTLQYEARQRPALIHHHPLDQHEQPTRRFAPGLAIVALAIVPTAFWASLAWFVWGWLGAAIAAIVVLVVSVFTVGLLGSASQIETPDAAAPRHPAPRSSRLKQAA
jgi:hypothetical protein